jgi:hypothetical protein
MSGSETNADQHAPGRLIAQYAAGLQPVELRCRECVIHDCLCSLSSKALAPRRLSEPVAEFGLLVPYDPITDRSEPVSNTLKLAEPTGSLATKSRNARPSSRS